MYVSSCKIKDVSEPPSSAKTSGIRVNGTVLTKKLNLQFASQIRRKEYFGWKRVCLHMLLGLLVYIVDIITDILVVLEYYKLEHSFPESVEHQPSLDSSAPPRLYLFYTFTTFLIGPLIVYNVISFALYVIAHLRLRSYIKLWLKEEVPSATDHVSISLSKSKASKFLYYSTMVLSHILLMGPVFRLTELVSLTAYQVIIASRTKFSCSTCKMCLKVDKRCTKHDRVNRNLTETENNQGKPWQSVRLTMQEVKLKLAYGDALQSWADNRFLQSVSSHLESLPQMVVELYAFYSGQLLEGQEWINYFSFAYSALTFCYSIASFRHMPYDYDALNFRPDEPDSTESERNKPEEKPDFTSPPKSHWKSPDRSRSTPDQAFLVYTPDVNEVRVSEHCEKCCLRLKKSFLHCIGKRCPKILYTISICFIIAPRVMAIVVLNSVSFLIFFWGAFIHLLMAVVCNLFTKIRVCYHLFETVPDPESKISSHTQSTPTGSTLKRQLSTFQPLCRAEEATVPKAFEDWSSVDKLEDATDFFKNPEVIIPNGFQVDALAPFNMEEIVSQIYEVGVKVRLIFNLPFMDDEVDGTYGPITFLGSAKMEQISIQKNLLLWAFTAIVQILFDIIFAIPFLFYWVNVQDLEKASIVSKAYYLIWYFENIAIVVLNISAHHVSLSSPLEWPSRLLGITCFVIVAPIFGFMGLKLYHLKFDPAKLPKKEIEVSEVSKSGTSA